VNLNAAEEIYLYDLVQRETKSSLPDYHGIYHLMLAMPETHNYR